MSEDSSDDLEELEKAKAELEAQLAAANISDEASTSEDEPMVEASSKGKNSLSKSAKLERQSSKMAKIEAKIREESIKSFKSDKLSSFDMFAPKDPEMESPKPTSSTTIINSSNNDVNHYETKRGDDNSGSDIEYQRRPVIHKVRKRKRYQCGFKRRFLEKPVISTRKFQQKQKADKILNEIQNENSFEEFTIPRKRKSEQRRPDGFGQGLAAPYKSVEKYPKLPFSPPKIQKNIPTYQPLEKWENNRLHYVSWFPSGENPSSGTAYNCTICKVQCTSQQQLDVHLQGSKHKKKMVSYYCKICNVQCTGQEPYDIHLAGKKHQRKVRKTDEKNREMENYLSNL